MRAAKAARATVDQQIGRFGGLDLGLRAGHGDAVPSLYLEGLCRYEAEAYQTTPGLAAALLAALASIPEQRDAARQQLAVRAKRMVDLQIELERPFEHADRLAGLLARQRRLQHRLDLDKDSAGAGRMDADDAKLAA